MGPYGIVQVDIPGAINAYRVGQQDRIEGMKAKSAQEAAERRRKAQEVIAQRMTPKAPQTAPAPAVGAGTGQAATPPAVASPAAQSPWLDRNVQQQLFGELVALDPEIAFQMGEQFSKMNDAQAKAMKDAYSELGSAAMHLRSVPPAERQAELARIAPDLVARGVPQEKLAGFDLSDRSLEYQIGQIRDIEKVIESTTPKAMAVTAGGGIEEYTPASPYPSFGAAAPAQGGPLTAQQAEPIIAKAQSEKMIAPQDAQAFIASVGKPAFEAWAKKYGIRVAPQSKQLSTGQTAYLVNGKWYDNPEGW